MDSFDDLTRDRLFKSVQASYRNLEPFRRLNRELVKEYAGPGYGQPEDGRRDDLIDLLNQAVEAYTMILVPQRPRVMVNTHNPTLQAFSKHFQVAINNLIEEIGLEDTLRKWVVNAYFSVGVIKIHLADSAMVELEQNLWADPGQPFASNVSLDNFVFDGAASEWENRRYAGDMYRVPFDDLKSDMYDQDAVKELTPTSKYHVDTDRLERISKGADVDGDEFEPMIDLADIWVPRQGKIYTYAVANRYDFQLKGKCLAAMDDVNEHGPYHLLGFGEVPENVMPSSPASHLSMLARLINNLMRKQASRAKKARRIHTFEPSETDTVNRIQNSNQDDQFVKSADPTRIGEVNLGGVDPQAQAFMLGTMEIFDRQAGNLTAMLGLGAQSDTVGQEQLIHSAGSKKESKMQSKVVSGTIKVIRDLAKLLWNDVVKVIPGQMPIAGATGYSVDATWTPEDREGRFIDYDLNIDVYSMLYQTPAQASQMIVQVLGTVYAPMMQLLVSQGGSINMQELTDTLADMLNRPELRRIVQFSTVPLDVGGMGEGGMQSPATTTRNYVRKSVSTGGSPASRSAVMQQAWMGGGSNTPQQAATMARPPA